MPTFLPASRASLGFTIQETFSPPLSQLHLRREQLCLVACRLVTKLCPTLCDPMDCSLPGSSVHRISQARILEWVASHQVGKRFFYGGGVGAHRLACGILVPRPEIKPRPPALEPWSLKH